MTDLTNEPQDGNAYDFVHHTDLVANGWNPNRMDPVKLENLTEALRRDGKVTEPLVVIAHPEGGKWMIVHGEKRWRAGMEAGIEWFPVVVEDWSVGEAKIRTLAMNNLRGDNDMLALATLLVDLYKDYSPEDIARLTGVGKETQDSALKELEVPVVDESPVIHVEDGEMPKEVTILLMPEGLDMFELAMHRALGVAGGAGIALVAEEGEDWTRALRNAENLQGMKLRNLAFSTILMGFNMLTEEQQAVLKARLALRDKPEITLEGDVSLVDDVPL